MQKYEWKKEFSVHVEEMDIHHKKLFGFINSLAEAIAAGKGSEVLIGVVDELLAYVTYHFSAEEKLLREIKFDGLEKQEQEHKIFTDEIIGYKKRIEEGKGSISLEVAAFLYEWFSNHILKVDKQYSALL